MKTYGKYGINVGHLRLLATWNFRNPDSITGVLFSCQGKLYARGLIQNHAKTRGAKFLTGLHFSLTIYSGLIIRQLKQTF